MTTPEEIARIAKGLDRAEREGMYGRILYINGRVRDRLVAKGILMSGGTNWAPLGLTLRTYLMEQPNDEILQKARCDRSNPMVQKWGSPA